MTGQDSGVDVGVLWLRGWWTNHVRFGGVAESYTPASVASATPRPVSTPRTRPLCCE